MKNLKLVTTVKLAIGTMVAIALAATAMMVWTAHRASFLSHRMNLAHQVYEAHLSLSANAYQLFKQYGDAMIIGDRDLGAGERELTAAVRADIDRIRELITEEIDHVGKEEIVELATLAEIETKMNRLIEALEAYRTGSPEEDFRTNYSRISQILDSEIDFEFRRLINRAIAEQTQEVMQARMEIARYAAINRALAAAGAIATIAAAFWAILLANQRIRRPVMRVIEGVNKFGAGDYSHRIALAGGHELSQIAQALDGMAAKIFERSQVVLCQQAELEQKVAERTTQLAAMLEQAEQASRNRRTLLSDVSHELKTPLTIIRGEADIALRCSAEDPVALRQALERTRDAAAHTARIVDDLLFIARTEEGMPRIARENVDLSALLHRMAGTFASNLSVIGAEEEAIVSADPGRICQALLILYDNARRHGGNNILFRLGRTGDGFRVAVEDDGPGMSDDEKVQAFERFYRGANAPHASPYGLGLGLPVARAIAEAHGSTIVLTDRAGGGLVAAFTLPAFGRLRAVS